MRKVKLVFVKGMLEYPTSKDTTAYECEFNVPGDFEEESLRLIGALVENPQVVKESPMIDQYVTMIDYKDINNLIGQLLTYIDATYIDQDQRKAHKDILKSTIWNWEGELRARARQVVQSHDKQESESK